MKRLLCIISGMNAGGAEGFLMKVYRGLDKSQYQMDFCINVREKCFYEDEILAMGGKIYRIPSKSENLEEFKRQLAATVRDNGYDHVMRVTSSAMGFMDLKIAKKAGASVCCARSSNSSDGDGLKAKVAHRLGRWLYRRYVDVKIAPSDLAAQYTFGQKVYERGGVSIVHNGVDLDVFCYDPEARERIRAELGVSEDTKLIGHVGRFDPQKNHTFLMDIFEKIHQLDQNTTLVMVGKGPLQDGVRAKAEELGLADRVIFTGVRTDVPKLLSAMDVFVFPSFYEGMPNTVIEAQATGLPCVIADTITQEANITDLVTYLPLGAPDVWAEKALAAVAPLRADTKAQFVEHKYDIGSVVCEFTRLVFGE